MKKEFLIAMIASATIVGCGGGTSASTDTSLDNPSYLQSIKNAVAASSGIVISIGN